MEGAPEAAAREEESSRAWQMLGMAHAENDKDFLAILALEKAVELDARNNGSVFSFSIPPPSKCDEPAHGACVLSPRCRCLDGACCVIHE